MKYSSLRAFEKHLEEASPEHFSPLYALLDKEPFQRKMAHNRLMHHLTVGQKKSELDSTILEAENLEISTLARALYNPSLFSSKVLVTIHNSEKLPKPTAEWLEAYFAKPAASIFLTLTASSLHHGTIFFKKLEKYGILLDIAEEKPWEKERSCVDWVQSFLRDQGKKIDLQTAQKLVKQVGTDGETLFQEMEKLICFVGERQEITAESINSICIGVNNETIWQLGEAVFKRDAAAALRISHALLDEGSPLLSLLRQLRTQFQTDLQVSAILAHNGTSEEITTLFPYMKGSILDRHCQAARHYGLERFKLGLLAIDKAEMQAKNSSPERELFEVLIVRLTR